MELNLKRPLLFFDIESTGLNIVTESIIELSFVKVFPDGEQRVKTWKIRPWDYENHCQRPITPGASEVNGVKDEDLADCPRFIEVVDEVVEWLQDSDLAGYNSAKFDLPMLAEEIERVRAYCARRLKDRTASPEAREKARQKMARIDINLHDKQMVDVQTIYHMMEPRNLKAAYRFYCGGKDFDNAHTAEADTVATYEVLKGQLDMYGDQLKNDVTWLAGFGGRSKAVDYAARLIMDEKSGEPVISFGKHKGKTAREVFQTEPGYFSWIEQGEFTLDTKRQFALLREKFEAERRKPLGAEELGNSAPKNSAISPTSSTRNGKDKPLKPRRHATGRPHSMRIRSRLFRSYCRTSWRRLYCGYSCRWHAPSRHRRPIRSHPPSSGGCPSGSSKSLHIPYHSGAPGKKNSSGGSSGAWVICL